MNYIKPEDIKAYVEEHPEGIAGMSEALAAMANHFVAISVYDCIDVCKSRVGNSDYNTGRLHCASDIKERFGIDQKPLNNVDRILRTVRTRSK